MVGRVKNEEGDEAGHMLKDTKLSHPDWQRIGMRLSWVVIALSFVDALTTLAVVVPHHGYEINPVMASLLSRSGALFLAWKVAVPALASPFYWVISRVVPRKQLWIYCSAIAGVALWYVVIILNNLRHI